MPWFWGSLSLIAGFIFSIAAYPHASLTCTEAIMKFNHFVEIDSKRVSKRAANEAIEDQLQFMYGAMAHDDVKGVPKGVHDVRIKKMERTEDDKTRVHYSFAGPVLIEKGPRSKDTFYLPRDPSYEGSYEPAIDPKTGINRSTDEHYQDFGDYWYFWDPWAKGSLLKNRVHFDKVNASFKRIKNTKHTYPEYENLVDKKTGTIPIAVFFGMDDEDHSRDAMRSNDLGAQGYRGFKAGLKKMGFKGRKMDSADMREILEGKRPTKPFVEIFEKETENGTMVVQVFYGPTGINEDNTAFHYFYKDALKNSSLMIYDGHSGLGGHLDIESIEDQEGFKIGVHPKKYQIFYFNSCTSYSYYNIPYSHKGLAHPTKTLDILTNGLETEFDTKQTANLTLVRAIDEWATGGKKQSYQSFTKRMEQLNLFSVNGDEDNPRWR